MQHKQRIAADQPRGVDAKSDVLVDAVGAIDFQRTLRLVVIPLALHGAGFGKCPQARQAETAFFRKLSQNPGHKRKILIFAPGRYGFETNSTG